VLNLDEVVVVVILAVFQRLGISVLYEETICWEKVAQEF
jgi:hypothetical protein